MEASPTRSQVSSTRLSVLLPVKKVGCCGRACSLCPRYQATLHGDVKQLAELASVWWILGWHDRLQPPDMLCCTGCSRDTPCSHGICRCAVTHGVSRCAQCSAFPCDALMTLARGTQSDVEQVRGMCPPDVQARLEKAFMGCCGLP